ncbi:MAG: hypothetical protein JSV86_18515 [Gemmatimonadota bacterium]|nr:MAG: hypothetical protein JSV86_18515 [Gemmatimonadota bacterium]
MKRLRNLPGLILAVVAIVMIGLFVLAGLGQVDSGPLLSFTTHVLAVLLGILGTLARRNGYPPGWSLPPDKRKEGKP